MKKRMKTLIALVAMGLIQSSFAQTSAVHKIGGRYSNGFVTSFYSNIDGKTLTFGLNEEAANDRSVWKSDASAPPTNPRVAVETARRKLLQLFPDKRTWTLKSVTLHPFFYPADEADHIELWVYLISFDRHMEPRNPHFPDDDGTVRMVVLMDGTAVDPLIEEKK